MASMSGYSTYVALVDDDASVRKAIARLLSASAFETRTYGSAQDFLNSLDTETPECLLLDINMPETTGLDLQRHMQSAGIDIPTIVITAFNTPGLRERCQSAGATGFLLKPIEGQQLIGEIQAAIRRHRVHGASTFSTLRQV
jgi:FixJ family two-component response regulator